MVSHLSFLSLLSSHPFRRASLLSGILFGSVTEYLKKKWLNKVRSLLPFVMKKSKVGRSVFMQLLNIHQEYRLIPFCCFFTCCLCPNSGGWLLSFHTSNLHFRQEEGGRRKMRADACLGDRDLRLHLIGQILLHESLHP